MKNCYYLRNFTLFVLAAFFVFLTLIFFSVAPASILAEEVEVASTDSLISGDALILTLRLQDGIWLDTALALEIDSVLEAARNEYDTVKSIHVWPDYVPTDLMLKSYASWTQAWCEGNLLTGNATIDSLTMVYKMTSVECFYGPWFNLVFAQPLKMPLLCRVYKAIPGVVYAEPNYFCCEGDDIEAFEKNQIWHLAFTHGWGDCQMGCIYRYYWYVTVDQHLDALLVEEIYRDIETPWIYRWNIPPLYPATVFGSVDELFSVAESASEWWVRRHAVEVIGRLFIRDSWWFWGDWINLSIFETLRDGVRSRRAEVFTLLRHCLDDPDPDVQASARVALNRVLGLPEESLALYFPLHVGNSWTFGSLTETIVDTQGIDANLYFRFDQFRGFGDILLRMTEDDKLMTKLDSDEQVWLDFAADVGDSWPVSEPGGLSVWTVYLQSKEDTVAVPAGTFTNCYKFWFSFGCCDNDWVEWYAPGVGSVKRILYGIFPIEYQLTSAVIDGVVISRQKGDVDGNGELDVSDVVCVVNIILGLLDPTPDQLWAADMNEDGTVNVLDIVMIVNLILEEP